MARRPRALFLFLIAACAQASSRYVIVMSDPPVAVAGNTALIERGHLSVKAALRAHSIEVTGETHTLLNALFIVADPADLSGIRALQGVLYVVPEPRFHLSLDRAEQLINVPAAWNLIAGGVTNAGSGVRIGIIDTGIESTHPAFQDPLIHAPANYPVCGVFQRPLLPLDCTLYTNNKVIVARSYVPLLAAGTGANPAADSRPDDLSPRDRVGHGTAVAMAAAGTTNTGPADTITGVAPRAFLGSYKVFGSPGVNDSAAGEALIDALTDALADGMNIAVMSLGSPAFSGPEDAGMICGLPNNQPCDPIAAAVENAVNAGMLVVVAAGNSGPVPGSMDSPGTAPLALTVGASTNSHNWANPLLVNGLGTFNSLLGGGPAPSPSLNAPLSDAGLVGDALGCNPLPPASLSGTYALVQRGTCTFVVKVQNLQAAGAAGAIITNNAGDNSIFSPGGLGGATSIPAALVGFDDGQSIRSYLRTHPQATANLMNSLQAFDVTTGNLVASFSSRGPVLGSGGLKPDVTAAGTDLYLPGQTYDPNGSLYAPAGYLIAQGTSFSAPQIAGVAALVKQANPAVSPLRIRSAIINTATLDITQNGLPASVLAVGAGRANAAAAVGADLIASPVSASFGIVQISRLPLSQPIQLTNVGNVPLNLSLSLARRTAEKQAVTAIDRPNLTLAPGQTSAVNLTLTGTVPDPGVYEGLVTVQGAASAVRIPYLYLVGDGVPANIVPIVGSNGNGTAGQTTVIALQLLDQFGVPVSNAPVRFNVAAGGGSVTTSNLSTDIYGFAGARVRLGPTPGPNQFTATAGGLTTNFTTVARQQPAISPQGVVNAASFTPGTAAAPGSYVAVFGTALADGTQVENTPYLPVAIADVSVSFDTATQSVPGHLHFVTPGQVNVQVPWELQGQSSAQMKVSLQNSSGTLYTLPLAPYAPGIFEVPAGTATFAAARDENFSIITAANPAIPGHFIQIYCNGLGPVTNQPSSGDPSPTNPLARTTTDPVVTIGGKNAQVSFSGLTPTVVGLYQLNVTVPDGVTGVVPVVVSIGGVQSKASNIPVR